MFCYDSGYFSMVREIIQAFYFEFFKRWVIEKPKGKIMSRLPIIIAPDKLLKTKAEGIKDITAEIKLLADNMFETMYDAPGIGLAAPQVGILERIIVVDCADKDDDEKSNPFCMINPEITAFSEEVRPYIEGCLSLPDLSGEVIRPSEIELKYIDIDGKEQNLACGGLLATCIQHEIDHLNGVLFVDHLSMLKKKMILKKSAKLKKEMGFA